MLLKHFYIICEVGKYGLKEDWQQNDAYCKPVETS